MADMPSKEKTGFRKTALTKVGNFKPAREGMTAGYGKPQPKPKGTK